MLKFDEELFYLNEHLHCRNYSFNDSQSLVETLLLRKDEEYQRTLADPAVFFIRKGKIEYSDGKKRHILIGKGKMFVVPPGYSIHMVIKEEASFLIFRISDQISLCESLNMANLEAYKGSPTMGTGILNVRKPLKGFIDTFVPFMEKGLRCEHYLRIKTKEMLFYLRAFYTKEEMALFFLPLLGRDLDFRNFVLANISNVASTEDLAAMANMSRTGFCGKFKKVMGETPSSYIVKYRASRIRHELLCTSKTHKTLCAEFGFSSLNLFTRFCRKHLGAPPGRLRKEGIVGKD